MAEKQSILVGGLRLYRYEKSIRVGNRTWYLERETTGADLETLAGFMRVAYQHGRESYGKDVNKAYNDLLKLLKPYGR